jgi:hypothetical protein
MKTDAQLRDIRLDAAMKSPEANNAYGDRAVYNAGRKDAFADARDAVLDSPEVEGEISPSDLIQRLIDAEKPPASQEGGRG